jgi:hypothetical protein
MQPYPKIAKIESSCAENIQFYPGKNAAVPQANKPDF